DEDVDADDRVCSGSRTMCSRLSMEAISTSNALLTSAMFSMQAIFSGRYSSKKALRTSSNSLAILSTYARSSGSRLGSARMDGMSRWHSQSGSLGFGLL